MQILQTLNVSMYELYQLQITSFNFAVWKIIQFYN